MSGAGWSLPAGCGALPGEEDCAIELVVPGVPEKFGIFWTEDDEILIFAYPGSDEEKRMGRFDFPWNDDLDEAQNIAVAIEFIAAEFANLSVA